MNPNYLTFSCCLCHRNCSAANTVQFPCCNPSPHFCSECVMANQFGTHCQVCGELWGLAEIMALFKQNRLRQTNHIRNRSEALGTKMGNKLQTGYNRSYEPNPHIENLPTGGAFVNDEFLDLIKREIRENQQNQQERKSFFKDPFAMPSKQGFFSQQNMSKGSGYNDPNRGGFRPTPSYQDENMMQSVVSRDIPNSPFFHNANSNPFPNFPANEDANLFSSAPNKTSFFENPMLRNFTEYNSNAFPGEYFQNSQPFDPRINARFNNNMREAEGMTYFPDKPQKGNDAMAIEPENIPDMGFLNLNSGQMDENQGGNQPQLIHINNLNIQNAALNSQFTYAPPPRVNFSTPSPQNHSIPKNLFNQNSLMNNEKMRSSYIFGKSSPFPDNRNEMRRSVSPIRNTRKSGEFGQLTPKNEAKMQKLSEHLRRFDNLETNKKFTDDFKERAGIYGGSKG